MIHGQQLTTVGYTMLRWWAAMVAVVTLQFTVHPTQSTFLSAEICGAEYDFHGVALDSTGSYDFHGQQLTDGLPVGYTRMLPRGSVVGSNGCDSVLVTLQFTVHPRHQSTFLRDNLAEICEGSTVSSMTSTVVTVALLDRAHAGSARAVSMTSTWTRWTRYGTRL